MSRLFSTLSIPNQFKCEIFFARAFPMHSAQHTLEGKVFFSHCVSFQYISTIDHMKWRVKNNSFVLSLRMDATVSTYSKQRGPSITFYRPCPAATVEHDVQKLLCNAFRSTHIIYIHGDRLYLFFIKSSAMITMYLMHRKSIGMRNNLNFSLIMLWTKITTTKVLISRW